MTFDPVIASADEFSAVPPLPAAFARAPGWRAAPRGGKPQGPAASHEPWWCHRPAAIPATPAVAGTPKLPPPDAAEEAASTPAVSKERWALALTTRDELRRMLAPLWPGDAGGAHGRPAPPNSASCVRLQYRLKAARPAAYAAVVDGEFRGSFHEFAEAAAGLSTFVYGAGDIAALRGTVPANERRVAFVPRAAAFAADRRAAPLLLQLLDAVPAAATALLPGAKLGQRDTAPRLRAADPRYEVFSMHTLRGRLQAAVRDGDGDDDGSSA